MLYTLPPVALKLLKLLLVGQIGLGGKMIRVWKLFFFVSGSISFRGAFVLGGFLSGCFWLSGFCSGASCGELLTGYPYE